MALTVPGLEQNYLYGQYAQGGSVPFGGLTVSPRVTPVSVPQTEGIETAGRTQYVSDPESGYQVAYTDNRGYTGLMGASGGVNSAGYKEKPGFVPRELCVA